MVDSVKCQPMVTLKYSKSRMSSAWTYQVHGVPDGTSAGQYIVASSSTNRGTL